MTNPIIPIDFRPGAHGHFLEYTLNRFFGVTQVTVDPFTDLGSSHATSKCYKKNRLFVADHWHERFANKLTDMPCIISIKFSHDDLLALSSVSLLRAGDLGIDNNELEVNTFDKLNNIFYSNLISELNRAYPTLKLSKSNQSAERYILREFFKFGFMDPENNGHWINQKKVIYPVEVPVFEFRFNWFYDRDLFVAGLHSLEEFLKQDFNFSDDFYRLHDKFLTIQIYRNHKLVCDEIISNVVNECDEEIPPLTLFQESYINGCLENIFRKEMPFHQKKYFTNTKDVLHYLKTLAPNL